MPHILPHSSSDILMEQANAANVRWFQLPRQLYHAPKSKLRGSIALAFVRRILIRRPLSRCALEQMPPSARSSCRLTRNPSTAIQGTKSAGRVAVSSVNPDHVHGGGNPEAAGGSPSVALVDALPIESHTHCRRQNESRFILRPPYSYDRPRPAFATRSPHTV